MKKILTSLILILYICISFFTIKLYSQNQLYNFLDNNFYKITISNYNQKSNSEKLFNNLNNFSNKNNLNIYRINFYGSTYNHRNINIWGAIGNINSFKNKFNIVNWNPINKNNFYLTSNIDNHGYSNLFNKDITLNIKSLKQTNNISINGIYYVTLNNKTQLINTIKEFKNNNLKIESISYIKNIKDPIFQKNNIELLTLMFIITLAILITFIYYIVSRFKEFGIKKLFGYSNKNIMIKSCIFDLIFICLKSIILAFIINICYLLYYDNLSNYLNYYNYWLLGIIFSTLIIIIFSIPCCFLIFSINTIKMIKNKKATIIIESLGYISKVIFSIILIIIFVNIFTGYSVLQKQSKNNNWNYTKNYCYLEYDVSYITHQGNEMYYNETKTSKILFNYINKNKGILIAPSVGLSMKMLGNNLYKNKKLGYGDNLNTGNTIFINNNYLDINPIYNSKGIRLTFNNFNNSNEVKVLIPQMYEYKLPILLKNYSNFINNTKYDEENSYFKHLGIKNPKEPKIKLDISIIKNNQKTFLYQPNPRMKTNNYSSNSIIVVLNSNDYSGSSYLQFLTDDYILPYIGTLSAKNSFNLELSKLGLNKYLINTPTVYSRFSTFISQINSKMISDYYLLIIIIFIEIILSLFMTLNYLEKDKYLNSVKYIYGYSLFKIYKKYIISLLILWFIISIIGILRYPSCYKIILLLSSFCFIVEFILSIITINLYSRKKIKDILKGE